MARAGYCHQGMSQLHTLTVQDVLWINLQVTNKVQHYQFAKLEEAVFYQYAYGSSTGLVPQTNRFVSGFLRMHPFDAGNEGTAFVAAAAFLLLNGKELGVKIGDAAAWIEGAKTKAVDVAPLLADAADSHMDVRGAIQRVLNTYGEVFTPVPAGAPG